MVHNETDKQVKLIEENYFNNIDFDFGDEVIEKGRKLFSKPVKFIAASNSMNSLPQESIPEIAFSGRSNVGKSSLINYLTNRKKLAKVSVKPGKTKLINHFLIDRAWYLVDLPGYGWAKVSKAEKLKLKLMVAEYLKKRENLYCVFLLIDSRHEPQAIDCEFMRWLGERKIPFAIVFTKIDSRVFRCLGKHNRLSKLFCCDCFIGCASAVSDNLYFKGSANKMINNYPIINIYEKSSRCIY